MENLDEPMQRLLKSIKREVVSEDEVQALSRLSVRQMAKVYEKISLKESPESILDWLRAERSANGGDDDEEDVPPPDEDPEEEEGEGGLKYEATLEGVAEMENNRTEEILAAKKKAEEAAWAEEAVPSSTAEDEEEDNANASSTANNNISSEVKAAMKESILDTTQTMCQADDEEVALDDNKAGAGAGASSKVLSVTVHRIPVREIINPQLLRAKFLVMKYIQKALISGRQKRIWEIDFFTATFRNMDIAGNAKKVHPASTLLLLEKVIEDCKRIRLIFSDASHSYELLFVNMEERERFYECASAIRPSIRVCAPTLAPPSGSSGSTVIDATVPLAVKIGNNPESTTDRELVGEGKINASTSLMENSSVWTAILNFGGAALPKDASVLFQDWFPKSRDLFAIALHELPESASLEAIKAFLMTHFSSSDLLVIAANRVVDLALVVLCRKRFLLKVSNIQENTMKFSSKGCKGAIGISLHLHSTSLCFITFQMSDQPSVRAENLQELFTSLYGTRDIEIAMSFDFMFLLGDFNDRLRLSVSDALEKIQSSSYSELLEKSHVRELYRNEGRLVDFVEGAVSFKPTYPLKKGTGEYVADHVPCYAARLLTKALPENVILCRGYKSCEKITLGEHFPLGADFDIRVLRPYISCFERTQQSALRITFQNVQIMELGGVPLLKPYLIMYADFCESPHIVGKTSTVNTTAPNWSKDIPSMESVNLCTDYLERKSITIVLRDHAHRRAEKVLRGTGVLSLKGHISGKCDVAQEVVIDLFAWTRRVGKLRLSFTWVAK